MTTGTLVFYGGFAVLFLGIAVLIFFLWKPLRYHPPQPDEVREDTVPENSAFRTVQKAEFGVQESKTAVLTPQESKTAVLTPQDSKTEVLIPQSRDH